MFLFRFIIAAAVVIALQYVLYRIFALRKFRYSVALSQRRVNEGETVELVETIENGGFMPLLWLTVQTRFDESLLFVKNDNTLVRAGMYHRSILSILPLRRVKRTYRIVCQKRGCYRLGAASVSTGDLLGMYSKSRETGSGVELYVYPLPLPRRQFPLPSRSWQGDMVVRRFILPDPFLAAGVRDYAPGDPMTAVNWKATAKTGRLVVHRRDYTADAKLTVFFNVDYSDATWSATDTDKIDAMEFALRLLASVLDYTVANGQRVGLRTNAVSRRDEKEISVPPAYGRAQHEELFAAMAELQFRRTRSFHMLLREAAANLRDADVLLMTRYTSKEIDIEAEALRRAGNKVEVYLIPGTVPVQAKRA